MLPYNFELKQRQRILRLEQPDVVLIQSARHPLHRPSLYKGYRIVFDMDDADFVWSASHVRLEECCGMSRAVIAGSRFVAQWCKERNANTTVVWTGTPAPRARPLVPSRKRPPVVAWAHERPADYRLERQMVAEIMCRVAERVPVEFWVYGVARPDNLQDLLRPVQEAGVRVRTFAYMPYRSYVASLEGAAVGLQPISADSPFSQGKSFGKILAYLSADVATVASNAADHPVFFRNGENGFLADTVDEWVEQIEFLLRYPEERQRIVDAAHKDFRAHLTTKAAAEKVNAVLRKVIAD